MCGFEGRCFGPRGVCAYLDPTEGDCCTFPLNVLMRRVCGFEGRCFTEYRVWRLFGPVRSLDPVR